MPSAQRQSSLHVMSALHPKADMCSAQANVRFVPIADTATVTSAPARKHISFRMIRSHSLVPFVHVVGFANPSVIGAAEYAPFSVPANAPQRPVPNAAKIKNASVPVGFVGVVVHH